MPSALTCARLGLLWAAGGAACALPGPDEVAPPILRIEGTVRERAGCPNCQFAESCEGPEDDGRPCWEDPRLPFDPDRELRLQWVWFLRGQVERPFTQGAETTSVDPEGRFQLEIRSPPPADALFQGFPVDEAPPGTVAFGFLSQVAPDDLDREHLLEQLRPLALVLGDEPLSDPELAPGWSASRVVDGVVTQEIEPLQSAVLSVAITRLVRPDAVPLRSCASVRMNQQTTIATSSEQAAERMEEAGGPQEWDCIDPEAGLVRTWSCPDVEGFLCTPGCPEEFIVFDSDEAPPPGWPCARGNP
ncbi:MAG: hypothetical protein AAFZ18_22935 [Myxococcota bacterium]